jgi:hypothetical protein
MSVHETTGMRGTALAGGEKITNGQRAYLVVRITFSNVIVEITIEVP